MKKGLRILKNPESGFYTRWNGLRELAATCLKENRWAMFTGKYLNELLDDRDQLCEAMAAVLTDKDTRLSPDVLVKVAKAVPDVEWSSSITPSVMPFDSPQMQNSTQNEKDMAMLIQRMATALQSLSNVEAYQGDLHVKAVDYLQRKGMQGSVLR